ERGQEVSVLFTDLAGFTGFAERSSPAEVTALLSTYSEVATRLTRRYGGEVETFMGDGMLATFNSRGNLPDHAVQATRVARSLQQEIEALAAEHAGWPRMRIGVNSGEAMIREIGGRGHVAYTLVGDTVNTGSRLERLAPVGGVLIGAETYRQLPTSARVEARRGLRGKGKNQASDRYTLLPPSAQPKSSQVRNT